MSVDQGHPITSTLSVWIVESGSLRPVRFEEVYLRTDEALLHASRLLKRAGASMLDLRNIQWTDGQSPHRSSLLVYDWVGTLPISVVIEGGRLVDKGIPVPEDQSLGPVPMTSSDQTLA